jgi:heterotetrameric sarcosine oxidase delta subunit
MLLSCPHCGPREIEEFRLRAVAGDPHAATAFARVYLRTNVTDRSVEHWQHERGCRSWLVVRRNPSTAEVLDVRLLAALHEDTASGNTGAATDGERS